MRVLYKYFPICSMCLRFFFFFTITHFLGQICSEPDQVFIDINIRLSSIYYVVIFRICSGQENAFTNIFLVANFTIICLFLPGTFCPSRCDTAMSVGCPGGLILVALHTSRISLSVSSWASLSGKPVKRGLPRLPCCSSWSSSGLPQCFSIPRSIDPCGDPGLQWLQLTMEFSGQHVSKFLMRWSFKSFWMSGHLRASVKHRAKWSGDISLDIAAQLGESSVTEPDLSMTIIQ